MATIALTACGLSILALLAPPREHGHYLLIAGLAGSLVACLALPGLRTFFALRLPSLPVWVEVAVGIAAAHRFLRVRSKGALRRGRGGSPPPDDPTGGPPGGGAEGAADREVWARAQASAIGP